ncbi:MAG: hypothetical protein LAT68_17455 [Cyclobacteriaceae bacterium]|nr:hypothetical protein [Cyclobacteriaceae bacterium]
MFPDYQQQAKNFGINDLVVPYADGVKDTMGGRVVAVWPAIGMVDVQFPHGNMRYPVEDLQIVEKGFKSDKAKGVFPDTVPGGASKTPVSVGPRKMASKVALYWVSRDRKYRPCKSERAHGKYTCPKCHCQDDPSYLTKAPYTRQDGVSEKVLVCPRCTFVIMESDLV